MITGMASLFIFLALTTGLKSLLVQFKDQLIIIS